jgi:hypothetical protein
MSKPDHHVRFNVRNNTQNDRTKPGCRISPDRLPDSNPCDECHGSFFVSVHSRRVLKPTRRGLKKLRQPPGSGSDPGAEKAASKIQKKCLAASNISTGTRLGGCGGVGGFRVVGSRVLLVVCRVSPGLCWVCTWGWQVAGVQWVQLSWSMYENNWGGVHIHHSTGQDPRPGYPRRPVPWTFRTLGVFTLTF